ncbi:MAG: vitamin K epoxide reductase family protein [Chloroflexota bacterium]
MSRKMREARVKPPARPAKVAAKPNLTWPMVLLALVGLAASGYLSYSTATSGALVCGGIGNCDAVQASAYARLMGVPVAYLGFGSYLAVGLGLAGMATPQRDVRYLALLGVLVVSLAGALFSAFLTYTEFFVLQAVCPWCVLSAATMIALAGLAFVQVRRESAN